MTASDTGVIIARHAVSAHQPTTTNPTLIVQLQAETPQTPLIAHFLPPDLPRVEDLPLQGIDITSGALAFEFSHDRIAEAFDRLQDDIKQWSTVLLDSSVAGLPEGLQSLPQQQQQATEKAVTDKGVEVGSAHDDQGGDGSQSAASEQGSVDTASGSGDTGNEASTTHLHPILKCAVRYHDIAQDAWAAVFVPGVRS